MRSFSDEATPTTHDMGLQDLEERAWVPQLVLVLVWFMILVVFEEILFI